MTESRVLAVLAHPDDEVFRCGGTLALLARRGVRVQVLTATRGEAGSYGDPCLCTPNELPALREQELRCACAALGIAPPRLLDYRDGALAGMDEDEAVCGRDRHLGAKTGGDPLPPHPAGRVTHPGRARRATAPVPGPGAFSTSRDTATRRSFSGIAGQVTVHSRERFGTTRDHCLHATLNGTVQWAT